MIRSRYLSKPLLLMALIIFSIILAGCGTAASGNWPGITAAGDRVYVAYNTAVMAIDIAEREQLWGFSGESGGQQFYAPPVVDDNQILFGDFGTSGGFFSTGFTVSVYALEAASSGTPTIRWVNTEDVTGRVFAKPLQVDNLVIISTSDNHIIAMDLENNGSKVWDFRTGNAVWGQPAFKDGIVFVTSMDRSVYGIDLETGTQIWKTTLGGANPGAPVVEGDLVYVGSFDRKLHALDVEDGSERWTADAVDWVWAPPVVHEGTVYFADLSGNVYAVDAETGAPKWESPQEVSGSVQGRPAVANGKLYVGSGDPEDVENPQGYLTALSLEDGTVLWQKRPPAPLNASPVVVGDSLVVAVASADVPVVVIEYNLETGEEEWAISPLPSLEG